MKKWNYITKEYDSYNIPLDWDCRTYCFNMDEVINCASCGKKIMYGNGYTSHEIHTNKGCFGYTICDVCHYIENKRRDKYEYQD